MFGLREDKYDWLGNKAFRPVDYETLKPIPPWHFFTHTATTKIEYYNKWKSIGEIFPLNSVGIVTAKDEFAIAFNKETLREEYGSSEI